MKSQEESNDLTETANICTYTKVSDMWKLILQITSNSYAILIIAVIDLYHITTCYDSPLPSPSPVKEAQDGTRKHLSLIHHHLSQTTPASVYRYPTCRSAASSRTRENTLMRVSLPVMRSGGPQKPSAHL